MGLACLLAIAMAAPIANAGTTTQLTNFGSNPKNLPMYLYTPSNVGTKPPLLLHLHACHAQDGGQSMCSSGNSFAQQADKYGFLIVCPSAVSSDQCWDVHSTADLTHDGKGSDAEGIMSAINYVIANKNADANRVYVAGYSSGGMMTEAMIGAYPDVFKAGAAFAGVAFGCFAQGSIDSLGWSSTCATGKATMTGAQWGDLVRAAYPGFTGTRPRIQLWHGSIDTTVAFVNFGEAIKEWTNVLGVSETPTSTENNALQTGWIRTRYADSAGVVEVEAIQETGKGHGDLVVDPEAGEAIRFLGLDGSSPVFDAGVVRDSAVSPDTSMKTDSAAGTGGATGGVPATGGAVTTGGTTGSGETRTTGGVMATGGTGTTGGMIATGGTGTAGGAVGAGGTNNTAGVIASGGVSSTGGLVSAGGSNRTGGSSGLGGAMATGGGVGTGDSGSGGFSTASQAAAETSGARSGGSTWTPSSNGSPSGCSCSLSRASPNRFPSAGLWLVLGLSIVRWRRRDSQ